MSVVVMRTILRTRPKIIFLVMTWDYDSNFASQWFDENYELAYAIVSFILAGYFIFTLCRRKKTKLKKHRLSIHTRKSSIPRSS
jgi:hypothetical protein